MLAAILGCALLGAASPSPPRRIVSLNMCADELVIALADPSQIAGLTDWARDPALSYYAARARRLPVTHRSAEEVLALRPDLVVGAPFRVKAVLAPLKARGARMVDLPTTDGLAGIEASITTIAAAVGHPDRGVAMIAAIRADLARVGPPPGRGRVAAYYQRQGYLTGTGTLVDEMMGRVGLVNLAGRLGRPALSQISLEQMALARPDFLVMDDGTQAGGDRGAAMLRHPLLASAVPPSHHLYLPQAMTVCGTPGYPRAVAMLAAEVRAADTRGRHGPNPPVRTASPAATRRGDSRDAVAAARSWSRSARGRPSRDARRRHPRSTGRAPCRAPYSRRACHALNASWKRRVSH